MEPLETLRQEVEREKSVNQSAVTLLNGLGTRLAAIKEELLTRQGVTNAALDELASDVKSSSDALAAAVTANTPAADESGTGGDTGADTGADGNL